MKQYLLTLLLLIPSFSYAFEFEGGVITIPAAFESNITVPMGNQGKSYGFKKTHEDGKTGTLLQISYASPGEIPELSNDEHIKYSTQYLLQFLGGVERRKENFKQTAPTIITIAGKPAAKATWTGSELNRKMEGTMYCYIYDSKIFNLHTQDFIEYKRKYTKLAETAFETINVNR